MARKWLLLLLLVLLVLWVGGFVGLRWRKANQPEALLARGRAAIKAKDFDGVEVIADRLEARGQGDRANLLRAESRIAQGRFAHAVLCLDRIAVDEDNRVELAALLGRCQLGMGYLREAYRTLSFVLSRQPDHADAHRGLAAIHYDLGNLPAARHHLLQVVKYDDHDGRPWRLLGVIANSMSLQAEAVKSYRNALERELPLEARLEACTKLADVLMQLTRYREALATLDQRAEEAEDDLATRVLRIECLWQTGKADQAKKLLARGLEESPNETSLLSLRGAMRLQEKQFADAVADLAKAAHQAPKDYRIRFNYARALASAGREDEARTQQKLADGLMKNLDRMAALSTEANRKPFDAGVRMRLAALCREMDRPELAQMWERAATACRNKP